MYGFPSELQISEVGQQQTLQVPIVRLKQIVFMVCATMLQYAALKCCIRFAATGVMKSRRYLIDHFSFLTNATPVNTFLLA